MIIDAHTHIGLKSFIVKPISEEKRTRPAFQDKMEASIEELIARMDANGVTRAVTFAYPLEEVDAVVANEYVLDAARAYPDRIIPFALVGDDIETWVKRGVRGFKEQDILQAPERFDLPRAYRAIADAGLPLLIHARSRTPTMVAERIREILRDAPALRVLVAHMGRHTPNTSEHVEANLLVLRGYPNVYFETSTVRDPNAIRRAVEILGEDRVVFGSDFPFNSFQDPNPLAVELQVIERANLAPTIAEKILSQNILACLDNR
ncbi:MAG: amidohydrolase [Anaerolineales bacterium]|nr:amidohydrolase [Anaerolineales bacterium]